MNEKGRAPNKRKQPLTQRVSAAILQKLEQFGRSKEEKKRKKAASRQKKKTAGAKKPFSQRFAAAILRLVDPKTKKTQKAPNRQAPSGRASAQGRPAGQAGTRPAPGRRPMTAEQRRQRELRLRRLRLRKRMIRIAAAVAVLVVVVLILSRTVLFKIEQVEITNPKDVNYTASQIVDVCGVSLGKQNLFSCDLKQVAKNIERTLPYIGKAHVERDFPKSLRITVTPTHATAAIAVGTGYLLIDADGKMLETRETAPETIPVLRCKAEFEENHGRYIGVPLPGKKADDKTKAAAEMISLYKKINAAARDAKLEDITLIDIRDVRAITLMYQNRLTLHLGTQDNLGKKLKSAAKTIAAESDASRTRTGAIDLTSIPYIYSRDTYESDDAEETTEAADAAEAEEVKESEE